MGLRLAEINYGRAKSLSEGGVWSKEALDSAETTYTQAQEDVRNAQALQSSAQDQAKAAESEVTASEKMAAGSKPVSVCNERTYNSPSSQVLWMGMLFHATWRRRTGVPGLPIFTVAQSRVIWVSANVDQRGIDGLRVRARTRDPSPLCARPQAEEIPVRGWRALHPQSPDLLFLPDHRMPAR